MLRVTSLEKIRSMTLAVILSLLAAALPARSSFADNIEKEETDLLRVLRAVRITNGGTKLDGILDESDWHAAPAGSGFVQRQPNDGDPATEKTTVKVVFDDECIYVAVRAFDSDPGSILGHLTRRDEYSPSDYIAVHFDSYDDNLTAFCFGVNPEGVKRDGFLYDGNNCDWNWNAVWEVETKIDEEGWVAEFAIPFSQLRYASGDTRTWGFQVLRVIPRNNENILWSPRPQEESQVVSCFGKLEGLSGLPSSRRLEILPYMVMNADRFGDPEENPFRSNDVDLFGGDNPDFNFKQLRTNLVFRWEFDPGSTIFLVWSTGTTDYEEEYGQFGFGRDMDRLFSIPSDNTFLVKINKWFSI